MSWTKCIFIVDEDVDVHDGRAVLEAAARYCRPSRDLEFVNGPLDTLDHAAPRLAAGVKMGFDCTRKRAGEEVNGVPVTPSDDARPPLITAENASRYLDALGELLRPIGTIRVQTPSDAPGWVFVEADRGVQEPERAGLGLRVLEAALGLDPASFGLSAPFVIVMGRGALEDRALIGRNGGTLFHWLANADASRDMQIRPDLDRAGFDATPKTPADARNGQPVRDWPPILAPDEAVRGKVADRWKSLGLANFPEAEALRPEMA